MGWQQTGSGSNFTQDGFLYSGGVFSQVGYPGAGCNSLFFSYPSGINDDGWIVGTYYDQNCVTHGFLLINGDPPVSFDPEGSDDTIVYGVNGLGEIVGFYFDSSYNQRGFIYNYPEGTFTTVDYISPTCGTYLYAINNNGTVLADSGCSNSLLLYDRGDFTSLPIPSTGFNTVCCGDGLNDFFEIVATYPDTSSVAIPQ